MGEFQGASIHNIRGRKQESARLETANDARVLTGSGETVGYATTRYPIWLLLLRTQRKRETSGRGGVFDGERTSQALPTIQGTRVAVACGLEYNLIPTNRMHRRNGRASLYVHT